MCMLKSQGGVFFMRFPASSARRKNIGYFWIFAKKSRKKFRAIGPKNIPSPQRWISCKKNK